MGEKITAIYERNDVAIREKEGLTQYKGFYKAEGLSDNLDGHVKIIENGIIYDVDYINGQKTGFFLDQKYNRLAIRKIAKGRRVLDCFTHTGSFALNAKMGGAEYVNAVDISEEALNTAKKNADLNSLDLDFTKADVFDLLTEMEKEKKHDYDFIILDPPAFTKSSATIKNAYYGYKEINKKAMRLLPRGGYFATCSCSHFMKNELFVKMLKEAAAEASVSLRQIECRQQSADHPILWNVPETDYLKFYIFQIV
jgi:23S rRNA (cytosine1962-C5)-methyltransferase